MSNIFINSETNDFFSFFRGIDLQDLLVETENYLLEYRDKLNLPKELTFGVELEYEGVSRKKTDNFIYRNLEEWTSKSDGSLSSGGEITSPIMTDEIKCWQELKKVCVYLSKKRADTMHNAGGHIHIGANVLGDDIESWKTFLKLYVVYEKVIFRFVFGDKINGRKGLLKYAFPASESINKAMIDINNANYLSDIRLALSPRIRRAAINLSNVNFSYPKEIEEKNTLEFRSPNATTNEVIWQNNINAFSKMLLASRDKVINVDFLDYKLKHADFINSENNYLYNCINLKDVLEFVDLVFDNNLDKIYFLRQYLKDFIEYYGTESILKAKKFIK